MSKVRAIVLPKAHSEWKRSALVKRIVHLVPIFFPLPTFIFKANRPTKANFSSVKEHARESASRPPEWAFHGSRTIVTSRTAPPVRWVYF